MSKMIGTGVPGTKEIMVEFGRHFLPILVPESCVELTMKSMPVLADPGRAIQAALNAPIGSPALPEIVRAKGIPPEKLTLAVAVSDITRPVPYKGEGGILPSLLSLLEGAGIKRDNIVIIVANGMHRPSTAQERLFMFGPEITGSYRIVDHDCEDEENLTFVGKSKAGRDVFVNSLFFNAQIRIATGLVESHFMAGVSGGRKSICPGLVDKRTIEKFHSPSFLESPQADNLILSGNPCHEEAMEVAASVGVDFIVNACLDKDMRPLAFYAGHLVEAHLEAYKFVRQFAAIEVKEPFDIVLTHGGYAGRNHYQAAKAACNALPIVKPGGTVIVAADNHDQEPIGGPEYVCLLHLLKLQGAEGYLRIISDPHWRFTKDQWEPEMWGKVLRKIGEEGLIYCSPNISREDYQCLPGRCGHDFLNEGGEKSLLETAREMVQNAVAHALKKYQHKPSMAFLREGPYAVPMLRP
ncbi:MAG: nickel-dependent lactate racemase [Smithellaceae bacterium]|nr:nickel-dependent lactate racemase [Smithellaceae bacterium]